MTTPPNKPVVVDIMDLEVSELFGNPTHHPSWVFPSSKKKKDDKIKDDKIKGDKKVAKKPPNAKCCSWPPYMVIKMPDGRIRSVNQPDPPKIKASANWGTSVPPKGWGSKALPADTRLWGTAGAQNPKSSDARGSRPAHEHSPPRNLELTLFRRSQLTGASDWGIGYYKIQREDFETFGDMLQLDFLENEEGTVNELCDDLEKAFKNEQN